MTNKEFSDGFDILYNNITSNSAPGLDEAEKSFFLTKAQDEILKSYFDPRTNKPQEGFDGSERRQIDFSNIINTVQLEQTTNAPVSLYPLQNTGYYLMPQDVLMVLNESLQVIRNENDTALVVIPIDYKTYTIKMNKPYKRPLKNQAWRINTNQTINNVKTFTDYNSIATIIYNSISTDKKKDYSVLSIYNSIKNKTISFDSSNHLLLDNVIWNSTITFETITQENIKSYIDKPLQTKSNIVEIIAAPYDIFKSYVIRYLRKPKAIILTDLENFTLDDTTEAQTCELDPILHQEILQRAVELAKASYVGDLSSIVSVGTNSATDKGYMQVSQPNQR